MSSSSSSSSSQLPYFCPRCGDEFRFSCVPELRAHLVSKHTYETLLMLSQAGVRSSRPGALLPLPGPAVAQTQSFSLGMEPCGLPLPLACLDLASSSASVRLLREMFTGSTCTGPPSDPSTTLALPCDPSTALALPFDPSTTLALPCDPSTALALPSDPSTTLALPCDPSTALALPCDPSTALALPFDPSTTLALPCDPSTALALPFDPSTTLALPFDPSTTLALPTSVQPFWGRQVELGGGVKIGLGERLGLGLDQKITRTFAEVEERVNQRLSRLKAELQKREEELEKQRLDGERLRGEKQEVEDRAAYLSRQVSAAMEMMEQLKKDLEGKEKELNERQQEMVDIEHFLRETAEREARAKAELQAFIEMLLERADRAEKLLLLFNTHTHHHHYTHSHAYVHLDTYASANVRGGRSLDGSVDDFLTNKIQEPIGNRRSYSMSGSCRLGEQLDTHHHYRVAEGGRAWTWNRRTRRHHSTEEEEEEDEGDDEEEDDLWSSADLRRLVFGPTHTPGSDVLSSVPSSPSCCHGDRGLDPDSLRLRAGLFCVFPYLDVRSLMRAAEVCCDWRFVARHPAVWTRLHLEDGRISAEFLITLSQWCTQTHTVVLKNLKPRSRRNNESREEYQRNTRGSVEPGVEAVLRSAGGSLLHLSVVQCPHILTERTLWLASCYCRNLSTLTYRSSSDPLGHEVLWALGAGCRNISSLQVAPVYPCQQPTRFGNRCLQTIGRCWPHLRSLSVGGAGCGTQGLVAVVRSCSQLQVLELERMSDLGQKEATQLCEAGLNSLHTLVLTHTPVSGQAILHFHSVCPDIRSIVLQVSAADYFEDPNTQEAQQLFGEILNTLKVLQNHPGLCHILQVKVDGS